MNGSTSTWTRREQRILQSLSNPLVIQTYLDGLSYHNEFTCRSPRRVLADRKANCMEGAMLAAAAFEYHGCPPVLVNLSAVDDDDHVIALYRHKRALGAVAQSAYPELRFRSPFFANLRSLVATYFDHYKDKSGTYTLDRYSAPFLLTSRKFPDWQVRADDLDDVVAQLDSSRHYQIRNPLSS